MRLFVASEANAGAPCNPFVVGDPCELRLVDDAAFGSSATVYRADVVGRECLVKVFRGGSAYEQRARDEYRLLVELAGAAGHAPVAFALGRCEVVDAGARADAGVSATAGRGGARAASLPAIAMERVGGVDLYGLRATLADGEGNVASADVLEAARHLTFALLCCSVTSHADARYLTTVSHRDVSANNVRFVMDGANKISRAVLIDFGQGVESDDPSVTTAGGLERSSTPFVGAPEMFDQRDGSARSQRNSSYTDTYSIGCLLYYLRVGDWPLREQVEGIARRLGFGLEGRQALCDLKMCSAIHLPAAFVTCDGDRTLDELVSRCTEPGVGKLEGRFDLLRLADRLGISEREAAAARKAVAANEPQVDPCAATVEPEALEPERLGIAGQPGRCAADHDEAGARGEDGAGASTVRFDYPDELGDRGDEDRQVSEATRRDSGGPSDGVVVKRRSSHEGDDANPGDGGVALRPPSQRAHSNAVAARRRRKADKASLALKVVTCLLVVAAVVVAFVVDVPKLLSEGEASAEAQTLVLYPRDEELSASQLRDAAALMQARLSNMDGAEAAVLDSVDGISVTLPTSLTDASNFEGALKGDSVTAETASTYLENDIESILANPLSLYLVDGSDEDAVFAGTAPRVRVYRTEIASAEACAGRVEGLEMANYLTDEASAYVRLTLTDEAQARLKEACGSWYDSAVFAFDLEGSAWSTASCAALDDGSFAVSAHCSSTYAAAQMLAAALTADEYPAAFDCEVVPEVTWEDPSSDNAGQVAADDIEGDDAWVVVAGSSGGLTEGEKVDVRTSLIARCEAMGVSYALGTVDGGAGIAVKLAAEGFDALAAKVLVAGSSLTLSYGTGARTYQGDVEFAEVDGHAAVRVSAGSSDAVGEVVKAACDAPGTRIYAEMLDIPLMLGAVDDASATEIVFDRACSSCAAVDDENAWLPKLVVSACETGSTPAILTYAGKADLSWEGSASLTGAAAGVVGGARSAAKRANPASKVGCEDGYPTNLLVSLEEDGNVGADELAASALAEARAAYEEIGFEAGPFTKLSFYYGDSKANPAVEVVFRKHRALSSSNGFSVEVEFKASGSLDEPDTALSSLESAAAADGFYAGKMTA